MQIWARLQNQALQQATVTSGVLVTVELSFRLNSQWIFPCTEIRHTPLFKSRRVYRSLEMWDTMMKQASK